MYNWLQGVGAAICSGQLGDPAIQKDQEGAMYTVFSIYIEYIVYS